MSPKYSHHNNPNNSFEIFAEWLWTKPASGLKNLIKRIFKPQNVTNSVPTTSKISETWDIFNQVTQDLKTTQNTLAQPLKAFDNPPPHICSYCQSKKIVKKGVRKKKYETQQIY